MELRTLVMVWATKSVGNGEEVTKGEERMEHTRHRPVVAAAKHFGVTIGPYPSWAWPGLRLRSGHALIKAWITSPLHSYTQCFCTIIRIAPTSIRTKHTDSDFPTPAVTRSLRQTTSQRYAVLVSYPDPNVRKHYRLNIRT